MSHATHFLERLSRVKMRQADTALALYRDPGRVRYMLYRMRLPPEVERIAVPLAAGDDAPHVILARDGAFVTCLGPGMVVRDAYRLTAEQLAVADEELQIMREAERGGTSANELLRRMLHEGANLSREDATALAAWTPLLVSPLVDELLTSGEAVMKFRRELQPRTTRAKVQLVRNGFRAYWTIVWELGHVTALVANRYDWLAAGAARSAGLPLPEALASMTMPCAWSALTSQMLFSAWTAARIGEPSLRWWLGRHEEDLPLLIALHVSVGLAAIGFRHPHLRAEVVDALRRRLADRNRLDEGVAPLLTMLIDALERDLGLDTLVDELERRGDRTGLTDELRAHGVPPLLRTWHTHLRRPEPALIAYALRDLVKLELPDLYLPAASLGPPRQATTDEIVEHLREHQVYRGKGAPRRVTQPPGRNDACACGSGRKYKHCCGRN